MPRRVPIEQLRNIGIIAHIDAGKTTTTERILYYTGLIHRMGEVDEGTAFTDYMEQEKERGITITSAAVTCFWREHQINIIDTPGHVDFTAEVQRSLRVLDGAVVVFCGVAGVQPQSEAVWHHADRYGVPRIAYINKMDRVGANFARALEQIQQRLKARPVAIQIPYGEGPSFAGVIDLISSQLYVFDPETYGTRYTALPIPEEYQEEVQYYRERLLEAIAEVDDSILEAYVSGTTPSSEDVRSALRIGTLHRQFVPVCCGSSLRNIGVQLLLDAIIDYLPSPADIGAIRGYTVDGTGEVERLPTDDTPTAALCFKVLSDPYVGRLSFLRLYSGTLEQGQSLLNPAAKKQERLHKLLRMYANRREEITEAYAGDIIAVPGLRWTKTGDTLCDPHYPLVFEPILFSPPVINQAIEARSAADVDRLIEALQRLADEDPTFYYRADEETGQILISGVGELHLEILVERLQREFGIPVKVGRPYVSYRETITQTVRQEGRFVRSTQGGAYSHYGHVVLELSPGGRNSDITFENALTEPAIPPSFIPAIERAIRQAAAAGPVAGYPVVDVVVRLVGGSYREGESSEADYQAAATLAFREGIARARPVLLEPLMQVEVLTPEEALGDVLADLNMRRGRIESVQLQGCLHQIRAFVPLAEMFGYVTQLRSLTQGRGSYTMLFSHYEPVPHKVTAGEKVLA
ncbi:MAG: elongation factor G [Candidatus Kapabacteria bacterium]|nr:elongation factor G [Candidatus Kapabacteria bacterium]MDW8011415.1 elongation factor G [Bacteroidota bacterium]